MKINNVTEINFIVLTRHTEIAAKNAGKILRKAGIIVYDITENDVVTTATGERIDNLYELHCMGSKRAFDKVKESNELTEGIFNGKTYLY